MARSERELRRWNQRALAAWAEKLAARNCRAIVCLGVSRPMVNMDVCVCVAEDVDSEALARILETAAEGLRKHEATAAEEDRSGNGEVSP